MKLIKKEAACLRWQAAGLLKKKECLYTTKLFNKNFLLLVQGQAVSSFGDALYAIVMGLWVYEMTGSGVMMGTIMAASMVPQIFLGPLAGVLADHVHKKALIVLGDLIRGAGMTLIALLAFGGLLNPWTLLLYGIVSGVCSSFFNPAMQTLVPLIVPEKKLLKANSIYQAGIKGVDMIGSAVSGMMYIALGAPMMFLINGISYFISAFTEMFIQVPAAIKTAGKISVIQDLKTAGKSVLTNKGLLRIVIMCVLLNFFVSAISVMFVPWFTDSPYLGTGLYGVFCAFQSVGILLGATVTSVFNIGTNRRHRISGGAVLGFFALVGLAPLSGNAVLIMVAFTLAFAGLIIYNNISMSVILANTRKGDRGKTIALVSSLCIAAAPLGKLAGGIIADVFSIDIAITLLALAGVVAILIFYSAKSVQVYMGEPPEPANAAGSFDGTAYKS